ncbi:MAG: MarR family transcriptional regulator [Rhizobiales bacterium]|nr:MarR family transcriptional regulator [Hyphomicrobiales bacterium]
MSTDTAEIGTNDVDKARVRLWLKILRVSRLIETELRANFKHEYKSTFTRFDMLATIDRFDGNLKMNEISNVLRVSNGNVTGQVDNLVEGGVVSRNKHITDRRAWLISLTAEGEKQFLEQARSHEIWITDLLKTFSHESAESLITELDRVVEYMASADRGSADYKNQLIEKGKS